MTEQNSPSAINEKSTSMDKTPESNSTHTSRNVATALSVMAILISVGGSAGNYYLYRKDKSIQQQQSSQTWNKVQQLTQQVADDKQKIQTQLNNTTVDLQQATQQLQQTSQELSQLRDKFNSMTSNDSSAWMIAQADYLINLAARKLWSDQDVNTAAALLKNADNTLARMEDPAVFNLRRALTNDLSTLSALQHIDYDGIILQLNTLSNQIDSLRLADDSESGYPMDDDNTKLSASLTQWRQNLLKSWHDFMDNFISIRRRDTTAQPLLAPDQNIYLRENIRSKLLIASQSVPRHQQQVYRQSLEAVSTWIRSWYNTNDPATKAFLDALDKLSQQSINIDLPETLTSQPLINQLMQTRVRGFMNTSLETLSKATEARHG